MSSKCSAIIISQKVIKK